MSELISKEACLLELELLKSIDASLKLLIPGETIRGRTGDGWDFVQKGKSFLYERTVTYTGAAQNIDLSLPRFFQLNRIEQVWNDATARDFSIRVFTDPSLSYYIELDSQTANTALNRVVQAGSEYKYPPGSRIRMYYANTTADKTVTIRIQVDEL